MVPGLTQLLQTYLQFVALVEATKRSYLLDRKSWKPTMGTPPFAHGPGDISTFASMYDVVRKLALTLVVGRFFGRT